MLTIEVIRKSMKGMKAIVVALNEHSLRFNGDNSIKLEKSNKGNIKSQEGKLFAAFNDYVALYFDSEERLALYKLYEKAHRICENPTYRGYKVELPEVKPILNQIIEFIKPDRFQDYIQNSPHLVIPPELNVAASKGYYPAETTITEEHYVHMVKMTLLVRVIYPIIFSLTFRYAGFMNMSFAEFVCGDLIKDNPHIINTEGWRKLQLYVDYSFKKRGEPLKVDGVGSMEYFVEHVLYNTVFTRLCCAIIPETEEGKNLATAINAAVRQHESSGSKWRRKDDGYEGEEEKRSLYERYQAKESVKSTDEEVEAEFFSMGLMDECDNERHVDRFAIPCMSLGIKQPELVEKIFDNIPPNWEFELAPHNLKLLQMVFKGDISIMIYWAANYTQLMAAIALAQVRLAEWGYEYLPSIVGAIHDPNGMRSIADILKLTSGDKDYLESICDVQSRNDEGRSFNEAIEDATDFLEGLAAGQWKSNLEYGVLNEIEIYDRVERGALFEIEIEPKIREEFMRLVRQISE